MACCPLFGHTKWDLVCDVDCSSMAEVFCWAVGENALKATEILSCSTSFTPLTSLWSWLYLSSRKKNTLLADIANEKMLLCFWLRTTLNAVQELSEVRLSRDLRFLTWGTSAEHISLAVTHLVVEFTTHVHTPRAIVILTHVRDVMYYIMGHHELLCNWDKKCRPDYFSPLRAKNSLGTRLGMPPDLPKWSVCKHALSHTRPNLVPRPFLNGRDEKGEGRVWWITLPQHKSVEFH